MYIYVKMSIIIVILIINIITYVRRSSETELVYNYRYKLNLGEHII